MGSTDETLVLKWNNHMNTFAARLNDLRYEEACSDVTIACDGTTFLAHKFVLSTCSDYLSRILALHQNKHQVLFFSDVPKDVMEFLLEYMYNGNISIPEDLLAGILKVAERLQIKGLISAKTPHPTKPKPNKKRKLPSNAIQNDGQAKKKPAISDPSSPSKSLLVNKTPPAPKCKIAPSGLMKLISKNIDKQNPKENNVEPKSPVKENKPEENDANGFSPDVLNNIKEEAAEMDIKDDSLIDFEELDNLNDKEDENPFLEMNLTPNTSPTLAGKSTPSKINECEICRTTFTTRTNLVRHIESYHKNIKYPCQFCDKSFTRKDTLKIHEKTMHVHNDSEEVDLECPKIFVDEESSDEEKEGPVLFRCEFGCDLQFDTLKELREHNEIHKENATCHICGTNFKLLKYLRRHLKKIHGPDSHSRKNINLTQ